MKDDFNRFPSTIHLMTLEDVDIRNDKVMSVSERNDFLRNELVVEEKVDGANLGISFDPDGNIRAQNRGGYLSLPGDGQWKKLHKWLNHRTSDLFDHLLDRYILFGEWCYAKHSVPYDRLPDWFLGFDIFDRQIGNFFSARRRNEWFLRMSIVSVPNLGHGYFTSDKLVRLISNSKFSDQPSEGLYLRYDNDNWLIKRAKLVRPSFIQGVEEHWSRSTIAPNYLSSVVHW